MSRGLPSTRQTCVDGDPTCDFDPAPGRCRLHAWECFGGADPRLGCAAVAVGSALVQLPRPTATGTAGAARQALAAAIADLGFPLSPGEACTRRIDIDVIAGSRRAILATFAYPAGGVRDRDMLRLHCAPAGS
jgi:hypothetical protein